MDEFANEMPAIIKAFAQPGGGLGPAVSSFNRGVVL
jgi:hypothetical protein